MAERLMLLPSQNFDNIRLLRIPEDFGERDVVRHVTALIAEVQEGEEEWRCDDVMAALEDHGFSVVDYILGPALDRCGG